METFLSPSWSINFGSYYSLVIDDNLFISFNPPDDLLLLNVVGVDLDFFRGNINAL